MSAGRDVVLVYHGIGSVPRGAPLWNGFVRPERFAAQMARLARERRVVSLDAIAEGAAGRGRVAITFDDAYRTALVHAVPVLRRLGLPATFFVPTRWIGERNTWDRSDGLPVDIMDSAELGALAEQGFAIESHGHAHIDYARAAPAAVEDDIAASVERLTALLGRAPRYLAYPYGRATPAAVAAAKRLGLRAGFTLDVPQAVEPRFAMTRISIVPADRGPLFALKLSGRYAGLRRSAPVRMLYDAVRPVVRRRWLWP
jgi:peptidoglycan/xylan/chitin deacetylase (PgdA/CDA1 family)